MADIQPMPQPQESIEPASAQMGVSDAMDVLDEFHIKRSDMARVMEALETVMGPGEEAAEPMMDGPSPDDAAAKSIFASDRNRKA